MKQGSPAKQIEVVSLGQLTKIGGSLGDGKAIPVSIDPIDGVLVELLEEPRLGL